MNDSPETAPPRGRRHRILVLILFPALGLLAGWGVARFLAPSPVDAAPTTVAAAAATELDAETQQLVRELIDYHLQTELTPEEEAIKKAALEPLPAACCADNSAYTCCCPCNLSLTIWGLADRLIREENADAERVRAEVQAFYERVNDRGYDGFDHDACYTGGCAKSYADGGCGGMNPQRVVF